LTRYKPTFDVKSGATDLTNDTIEAEVEQAITNKVSNFKVTIDDRFDKWSGLGWNDPIAIGIEGTRIIDGRIDEPRRSITKKDGRVIYLTGRGIEGALQDVISSLYFDQETAQNIVGAIINEYGSRKLSADPTIYIDSNLAPSAVLLSFHWKRKALWEMLKDVADALSAPTELGGDGKFYDFYVASGTSGGFRFEPCGYRSSGVTIPQNVETLERHYIIDSLPVKNDIWVWGSGTAGTIPLEMQIGYNGGVGDDRTDPWTEGNAADYVKGDNCNTLEDTGAQHIIGSQSIHVVFTNIANGGRGYFYLPFPFSKWEAQPPGFKLNAYNETKMTETMGEISGIGYFIRNPARMGHMIEVVDQNNLVAQSEEINLEGATFANWFTPVWKYVQLPFGPSSNYKCMSETDQFDWSRVKQVRWVFFGPNLSAATPLELWYDGFRFIKPLVVNQTGGDKATRRTLIQNATSIASYSAAKIYAKALLESFAFAQQYFDFENLGRVDIPIGQKFTFETRELVLRECTYTFNKDNGWTIKGRGFEAT
jgi:hypothetical protein